MDSSYAMQLLMAKLLAEYERSARAHAVAATLAAARGDPERAAIAAQRAAEAQRAWERAIARNKKHDSEGTR